MASVFASLSKTLSPSASSAPPQSAHGVFVHTLLLPLTVKLQKETRGRRYKEVQSVIDDAVRQLKDFGDEEWPPPKHPRQDPQGHHIGEDEAVSASTSSTEESSADDASKSSSSPSPTKPATEDDDPQTREPMHPAVEAVLEAYIAVLSHPAKMTKPCDLTLEGINLLVKHRYVSGRAGGQDDTSGSGSRATQLADKEGHRPPPASLLHRLMEAVAKCSESNVESTQSALIRAMTGIMTSPKCGVHESSMLLALRSTFHVYLVTKSTTCKEAAKSALLDMLRSVMARMEAYNAVASARSELFHAAPDEVVEEAVGSPKHEEDEHLAGFISQYHADSYVLFRSLCKMSSKELAEENASDQPTSIFNIAAPSDPMSLNGKILSLELILAAMDFAGEAFCESERFIYLVQNYLCVSLLKNCMSNHTQVAFLSQKIFLVLVFKFKGYLKQEIEVFMSNVFLRVLESPNSSFKQKALVLESLRSLCRDPVLLTQIFLNYDCDFEARNLYKEIVHMLTKLGGKATSGPALNLSKKDAEQEFELSLAGLEVLTTILRAFLKAQGLPGGDEDDDDELYGDTAGSRIRSMLQLDFGMAARPVEEKKTHSASASVASDDLSGSGPGRRQRQSLDVGDESSNAAGKIVDAFQMKRHAEQTFEMGAVKFTLSLKSGLNFFIDNKFVECDARSIALFFLANKDKLDKTQMGEALGREPDAAFVKGEGIDAEKGGPGFWVRILHHYVDALDFSGLVFDDAIRLFLSGFRLPGEAQKIDRIMEKFAERFTWQNPDVFPSADTAFILAFSVIMLNTDLHNPSIKPERRMTVDSFIRNNRGVGENGGDLPEDFLTGIFNRIKKNPFSLKEDDAARERVTTQKVFEASVFFESGSLFGDNAEERRKERFKKERDEMMAATQQLVRRRGAVGGKGSHGSAANSLADNVAPADVVGPMFDVTWGPILGILSQVLECSDDERSTAVCLVGFVYAVRIAAHNSMSLARDTFVSSLAKFTFLGSIKEMKSKNIDSTRTLLSIAVIDGEHLGESWGPVLQCISQVARLRLTGSGLASDESFLVDKEPAKVPAPPSRVDFFRQQPSKSEVAREAQEVNGKAVLEAVQEVLIDKVFSSTVTLSATSLAHFIEQLIGVSSAEIAGKSKGGITGVEGEAATTIAHSNHGEGPSVFSLQRLVEVADYNMDVRPRLVWAQVWEKMADYFAKIACTKNARVSFFAIDALKQLSSKFLEKPELSEFNFQRLFLNPFLVVMEDKGSSEDIREMVLQCIDHIIRTKSRNLRSGWKVVFAILKRSASDPSEKIDFMGLSILQRLLDSHLHELCSFSDAGSVAEETSSLSIAEKRNRNANVEDFVGLCRASLSFVRQDESDSARPIGLSMRAFSHTAIYADLLASGRVLPPVSGAQSADSHASGYTYSGLSETESLEMALWRPLFEGLAEGVRSAAKSSAGGVGCLLQRSSVLAFRAILLRHGHIFSTPQLVAVLEQTLIPAIQTGCENDISPVVRITSESPSVSSIDFLVEPLPLPPPPDDESLLAFKSLHRTPNREIGPAELMMEASFSDMRHGGNGDLRKAYALAKRDSEGPLSADQPFPDSWVATTAPVALGLLTDIVTELVVPRGQEGMESAWPLIASHYTAWCVGKAHYSTVPVCTRPPCEALVRVACREVHRLTSRLSGSAPMSKAAVASPQVWAPVITTLFSDLIALNVEREETTQTELARSKRRALLKKKEEDSDEDSLDEDEDEDSIVTPYGRGKLVKRRINHFRRPRTGADLKVVTSVVKLEFGATLFLPVVDGPISPRTSVDGIPIEVSVPGAYWEKSVPELKVRCIAAYCLHQSLAETMPWFLPYNSQDDATMLFTALQSSRQTAARAIENGDVSTAFQEALFSEWGDGVAVVEEALDSAARLSHLHGSGMFFLAQEAGATNSVIRMLSILYSGAAAENGNELEWKRASFAEAHLFAVMKQVHEKFLESEKKDGHLIDPNVWRTAGESGGKVALYCTAFAFVVVEILKIIRSLHADQFAAHKKELFPMICALVPVQSEEIRHGVSEILAHHIGPLIGVESSR